MEKIPIGVQLYSVREDCKKDLPGVLSAVARMGYAGVEFAGYHGYSAADLLKLLDERGLKCCGTHTQLDTLLGAALPATIEFNRALGNPYLIVPGLPENRRNSRAAWLETAGVFNELAAKVKPHGMRVGYHNHHIEFTPLDGELPWDTFFGAASPDVIMQMDTGNCMHGKADPLRYLAKYPGRAATMHLKEYSASNDKALVGEGEVKWREVFDACETIGKTEWYIVEQESYPFAPLECIAKCLENLKAVSGF